MEANREAARRYFEEMWNPLDARVAAKLVAPDVEGHVNSGGTLRGIATLEARIATLGRMYARMRFTIEDIVAERDRVVVRWVQEGTHSGAAYGPATAGKTFRVRGMNFFRFRDGLITEIWVVSDDLGELEQVGAVKLPPA